MDGFRLRGGIISRDSRVERRKDRLRSADASRVDEDALGQKRQAYRCPDRSFADELTKGGVTSALEREVRKARQANDTRRKASTYFAQAEPDPRSGLSPSSLITATPMESSRSAVSCRSRRSIACCRRQSRYGNDSRNLASSLARPRFSQCRRCASRGDLGSWPNRPALPSEPRGIAPA